MRLGRVIGRVTLSRQDPAFRGARWLIVSPMSRPQLSRPDEEIVSASASAVVYDDLGAGRGDIIGFVEGAEATAPFDRPTPIDAYNAAIIENLNYQPAN
ncbi:ethanolamine utilization protein EutN [Ruficoccus amylovorans]|uniref:Ethanolamine utilization protein EutN n=1 Tax=Ruficoccus amylovorans TaxID=1804625 RepID=A0A842HAI9_9BACT|nr:EutN/CcmL family microcompartment protein [Ruficoccus amylovorans]MBC2593149.1 ethanolamine utilization protein EutN [Ruficoccus amylovorans]